MYNEIYALHDYDLTLKQRGAFAISIKEAVGLNEKGYGIYHTVNLFSGARKKENLARIRYWIADIDVGDKKEQMENINKLTFYPSMIIETKKGYHCYWQALDATVENYQKIEQGIIRKLKADEGCKDVSRILRSPGYNHMKDPKEPFKINEVGGNEADYREKEMLYAFPIEVKNNHKYSYNKKSDKAEFLNPDNWNRIFGLDRITNGNRNNELARITFWLKDEGLTASEIENVIKGINQRIDPLPEREINSILKGKI